MWKLENKKLDPEQLLVNESLFTLANGYLGVRGCFEEGYNDSNKSVRGTYINGFYEIVDVKYGEKLFGFPETQEKLPNLIDAQTIHIYLDGEKVSLFTGSHSNYNRALYFDRGFVKRTYLFKTESGKVADIEIRRMVSLKIKELFLMDINIKYDGDIVVKSSINGDVENFTDAFDPRVSAEHSKLLHVENITVDEDKMIIESKTHESKLTVSCAASHVIKDKVVHKGTKITNDNFIEATFESKGSLELTKYVAYTDSKHHINAVEKGKELISQFVQKNFEDYLSIQKDYLDDFWSNSDISIYGNELIQQGVRFNLFQLLQSVGKDGLTNISAKGLTGEGYEGHYFWDTEIYVLPMLQLTQPEIAKKLLIYRYSILDSARERARELGHKRGAKFPWRTIAGRECSTFFPAGTAQYHINGDVAYSFIQSYLYHKDLDFMSEYGAEVLFETARLWLDIGHFYEGQFMIHDVTGPDEYTCVVDNNYYTNLLAQYNLKWAVKIYELLNEYKPQKLIETMNKINMSISEIEEMKQANKHMYLPYDEKLGINKQDDSFLQKKVWDFENTPKDKYPLLLHYHPLTIYRYQVIKQADTVLAHFLLEDYADPEVIKKSFDYYESVTTHDSSLSSCIYGIMASKCGYYNKAYDYFMESVRLDLDNTHGNTKDGLHIANLAGTVLSIVFGFGGYRIKESGISLSPSCPSAWKGFEFKINYKESHIRVKIKNNIDLELLSGEETKLEVYGKEYILKTTLSIDLRRNTVSD